MFSISTSSDPTNLTTSLTERKIGNMLSQTTLEAEFTSYPDDGSCGNSNESEPSCHGKGICSNKTCFCDMYHSGVSCEKDIAHPGVTYPLVYVFYIVAGALGLTTGAFIAKIYNMNGKRLFK